MRDIIQKVIDSHKDHIIASDNWGDIVETLFKECKQMQDTHGHIVVACHKCNPYLEDVEKETVEFFRAYPHSWKDYIEWVNKKKQVQQEPQQRQISDFFESAMPFESVADNSSPCDTETQSSSESDATNNTTAENQHRNPYSQHRNPYIMCIIIAKRYCTFAWKI